jgi:hypothetical protein
MDESEVGIVTEEAGGLSRRDLIKRGAVVGGIVWAAPVIDSFASKAFAGSRPPGSFPCSYALIVFTINGGSPVAVKLNDPNLGCNLSDEDGMYGTETLGAPCNGVQYAIDANNHITAGGTLVPAATGNACSLFTINGSSVTADSSVNILFVLIHDGSFGHSCSAGTVANGTTICGPGSGFQVPTGCCG